MNYKEAVVELVQHLNDLIKDPLRKYIGKFEFTEHDIINYDLSKTTIKYLSLVYTDVDKYIPIVASRVITFIDNTNIYEEFYHEIINYILFARYSKLEGFDNNKILTIPISKLMEDGYEKEKTTNSQIDHQ